MNNTNSHRTIGTAYGVDDQNVVYSDVVFQGASYCVQLSRPRHPSSLGEELDSGADIHTDEGHDDNAELYKAVSDAGLDWDELVSEIVSRSDAEAALDRIQTA